MTPTDYTEKNRGRRGHNAQGRAARKAHAVNGAFGSEEKVDLYNDMVRDTTGAAR